MQLSLSMQLLNTMCAAHRGVQAFATSKRHMRAHEVKGVSSISRRQIQRLWHQVAFCNCKLVNALQLAPSAVFAIHPLD